MISIKEKSDCAGCSACVSVCPHKAISFERDSEGFLYPKTDNRLCVNCHLCEEVCPIISIKVPNIETNEDVVSYASYALNDDIRKGSSSGGVFLILAKEIIDNGGVVYGVRYNDKMEVVHDRAEKLSELSSFSGSKYVQSNINGIFQKVKNDLIENRLVFFSGTPCQVQGLKLFLRKHYNNLICCDLLCYSVPSPMVFHDYIKFVQKKVGKKVQNFHMRSKDLGWGENTMKLFFEDGSFRNDRLSNLWSTMYWSRLIVRPSCFSCKFTSFKRCGDISIGDYWGLEKVHPELIDKKGVSLVLVNNDDGKRLIEKVKNKLFLFQTDLDSCLQPSLLEPISKVDNRSVFWKNYHRFPFSVIAIKYWNYGIINRIKWLVYSSLLKKK